MLYLEDILIIFVAIFLVLLVAARSGPKRRRRRYHHRHEAYALGTVPELETGAPTAEIAEDQPAAAATEEGTELPEPSVETAAASKFDGNVDTAEVSFPGDVPETDGAESDPIDKACADANAETAAVVCPEAGWSWRHPLT